MELVVTDDGSTDETADRRAVSPAACRFPVAFTTHSNVHPANATTPSGRRPAPYLLFIDYFCCIVHSSYCNIAEQLIDVLSERG